MKHSCFFFKMCLYRLRKEEAGLLAVHRRQQQSSCSFMPVGQLSLETMEGWKASQFWSCYWVWLTWSSEEDLQKKKEKVPLDQALWIKKIKMLHAPALSKVSESIGISSLTAIMISAGKVRAGPRLRVWVLSIYLKAMIFCKKITLGYYEAPKKARVFCYKLFNSWGKKSSIFRPQTSYRRLHFVFSVNKTSLPDYEKSLFSPEWELELLAAPCNDLILGHSCCNIIEAPSEWLFSSLYLPSSPLASDLRVLQFYSTFVDNFEVTGGSLINKKKWIFTRHGVILLWKDPPPLFFFCVYY